jgi:2-C-methyl-D-erythritol 4-phosphate cytidylyltransferase
MGTQLPKQFLILGGEPILARTINTIHEALPAAEIVVVMAEQYVELWRNLAARFEVARHKITIGGKERFHSVKNGIAALSESVRTIAVHDAVRPLATKKMIIRLILEAEKYSAVIPVVAPVDSYRIIEGDTSRIINRAELRMVQTPQVFAAEALREAYEQEFSELFTDDASVMEAAGHTIKLCEGEQQNIKITRPEDITIAEAIIASREQESDAF